MTEALVAERRVPSEEVVHAHSPEVVRYHVNQTLPPVVGHQVMETVVDSVLCSDTLSLVVLDVTCAQEGNAVIIQGFRLSESDEA